MEDRKAAWTGWKAIIRPCYPDSTDIFGIWWENAPAMERRGGYSGPYPSRDTAEAGAWVWVRSWDMTDDDLTVIHEGYAYPD